MSGCQRSWRRRVSLGSNASATTWSTPVAVTSAGSPPTVVVSVADARPAAADVERDAWPATCTWLIPARGSSTGVDTGAVGGDASSSVIVPS